MYLYCTRGIAIRTTIIANGWSSEGTNLIECGIDGSTILVTVSRTKRICPPRHCNRGCLFGIGMSTHIHLSAPHICYYHHYQHYQHHHVQVPNHHPTKQNTVELDAVHEDTSLGLVAVLVLLLVAVLLIVLVLVFVVATASRVIVVTRFYAFSCDTSLIFRVVLFPYN